MAKIKKLRHLRKIRIHHNRWLIWAVAYVLFVGIAMLGYLKIANLELEISENYFKPWHSYNDERLGFSLRYPAEWSIEASESSIAFLPSESADEGVTITVSTPSSERLVRRDLHIAKEANITIDDTSASKLSNDLGEGHFETVVIVPFDRKLYVIRGSDNLVEKLLQTFYFLSK